MSGAREELLSGWKRIKITCPERITLGDGLLNWLKNDLPSCQFALGVLDADFSDMTAIQNNTCYEFVVKDINSSSIDATAYKRIRLGVFTTNDVQMTSSYACVVERGATFVVFYIE